MQKKKKQKKTEEQNSKIQKQIKITKFNRQVL